MATEFPPIPTISAEHLRMFSWAWGQMQSSEDRTVAIIGGSAIEEALRLILLPHFNCQESKFVESVFEFGSLQSYKGRSDMAQALGLIDSTLRRELDVLQRIRNRFAHDLFTKENRPTSFSSVQITKECDKLKMIDERGVLVTTHVEAGDHSFVYEAAPHLPRDRYIESVKLMIAILIRAGEHE